MGVCFVMFPRLVLEGLVMASVSTSTSIGGAVVEASSAGKTKQQAPISGAAAPAARCDVGCLGLGVGTGEGLAGRVLGNGQDSKLCSVGLS